jgi:subtilisin family serine protease
MLMTRHKFIQTGLLILLATQLFAQGRFLVRVPHASIGDVAGRHGMTVVLSLAGSGKGLYVVQAPDGANRDQALKALAADPDVQYAEADSAVALPELAGTTIQTSSTNLAALSNKATVDFYGTYVLGAYVNQEAALKINLDTARSLSLGAGIVAFIDTGVDPNHYALKGSLVQGYDFTRNIPGGSETADLDQSTTNILDQSTTSILDQSTTSILDNLTTVVLNQSTTAILDQSTTSILDTSKLPPAFGHGTMIAGLIHLVAPHAKLMPVKVFGGDGTASVSMVVSGIYYAVDNGADVISMSFSATEGSQELTKAINYANSRGVICVAAAGNEGKEIMVYPAGLQHVIGVGSTNNNGVRSSFSNYGKVVTVATPGENIITLYPFGHYAAGSGTSDSAPQVAGGAALLIELWNKINESQAEQALSQALPIGQGLGAGELDLYKACLYAAAHGGR